MQNKLDSLFSLFSTDLLNNISWQTITISLIATIIISFILIWIKKGTLYLYIQLLLWLQTYELRKNKSPNPLNFLASKLNQIKVISSKEAKIEEPKRQPEGLVGTICINIDKISSIHQPTQLNRKGCLNKIYFADEYGDYENRDTRISDDEIRKQCHEIEEYYNEIAYRIGKDRLLKEDLFIYQKKEEAGIIQKNSIIDEFKNLYCYDTIKNCIDEVNKKIEENNAIHFIGDKIGIKGFEIEKHFFKNDLKLSIYKTDHFTWQVFKKVFKDNKSFFQEIMRRVNAASRNDQNLLVNCLAFAFSSFGIDIIVEGKDSKNKRNIIISARSGRIESNKKSTLHVSVNESFSRTDYADPSNQSKYCVYACVKRGIQEELGILESEIKNEWISFHDFAIVTDEAEIGLSCHVDLSELMPIEQLLMYPGQDKYLETEEFLVLPYPKMSHGSLLKSVFSKTFMRSFYERTKMDRFCEPWMSFTPLLISRVLIRNIKYNLWFTLVFYIGWFILIMLPFYLMKSKFSTDVLLLILTTVIISLIIALVEKGGQYLKKTKKYLQPFVSQFYSNAKVIQATGNAIDAFVYTGITFSVDQSDSNTKISLKDLYLKEEPCCSVRVKRNKSDYNEAPISFFQLVKRANNKKSGLLKFNKMNIIFNNHDLSVYIVFVFKFDKCSGKNKIKSIRLCSEIKDDIFLEVKDSFENVDMGTFRSFFKLDENQCEEIKKSKQAHLTDSFTKKYYLRDLFKWVDGNYYWSCIPDDFHYEPDIRFVLENKKTEKKTQQKDFYKVVNEQILQRDLKKETFRDIVNYEDDEDDKEYGVYISEVTGNPLHIEKFLNDFIGHPGNKRRIPELDLYMMQLYCIRKDIVLAETEYSAVAKMINLPPVFRAKYKYKLYQIENDEK